MKPSEDPRSPFNPNYQGKINWGPLQKLQDNAKAMTRVVENARAKDPLHDVKKKITLIDRLATKKFHIYAEAGAPKK